MKPAALSRERQVILLASEYLSLIRFVKIQAEGDPPSLKLRWTKKAEGGGRPLRSRKAGLGRSLTAGVARGRRAQSAEPRVMRYGDPSEDISNRV